MSNPSFVSAGYASPSVQSQQCLGREWYPGSESQEDTGNHNFTVGNMVLPSGVPVEGYNNGHNPPFGGDQSMPEVPSNGRTGGSSLNFCNPRRSQAGIPRDDRDRDSHPQHENISSSLSSETRQPGRSMTSVSSTLASSEGIHPRWKKIGNVYSNDDMTEFGYYCHVDGCSSSYCDRLQELKRHWNTFHEKSIVWCPVPECKRSKAVGVNPFAEVRKDKLKDHIRNVHDMDLDL